MFTPESWEPWQRHINSETKRTDSHQTRLDALEARGLNAKQFAEVRQLTDALFGRIKASEEKLTLMGARIAELEAMLGIGAHERGLRVDVMDSGARV